MTPAERRRAWLVFTLMLCMALIETVGVVSVMPFVMVLASPDVVRENVYFAAFYDALGFQTTNSFLIFLGSVVFLLFIFTLAFKALTTYAITRFSSMRLHTIGCRLLSAYLRQPYEFFLQRNSADLGKSILSEVSQVTSGVLLPLLRIVSGMTVATALLLLLLYVEPFISIFVAVLLGGSFSLVYFFSRKLLKNIGEDRLQANKERFVLATEVLNGIKELKLLGRDHVYLARFKQPSERFARHQATSKVVASLPKFAIQAIAFGGVLLLSLYLLHSQGGLNEALPLIALYAMTGNRLLPAFQEIFSSSAQLRFALPVLDVLYKDLTLKEKMARNLKKDSASRLQLSNKIDFQNVTYRYPAASSDALKNLNMTINAETCVGFVGSTGAGKSTAIDLILGLFMPTEGSIKVGGQLLNEENMRAWQNNIGYVPQSIYLADDTVKANIAFGIATEDIDEKAVKRAAEMASIHNFINQELDKGYETIVGENGVRLSGGQRQRLAIARALYHDPDVMIFDEATSALDTATEKSVMEAIYGLHGKKTIILIAHRLSTVRQCDHIFVLQNGSLIDSGTYDNLIEQSNNFRTFVAAAEN